jgi:hypothetical protein
MAISCVMLKTANSFRTEAQREGEGRQIFLGVTSQIGELRRAGGANTATHHLTSRCSSPRLRPRAKTVADAGDLRRVGRSAPTIGGNRSSDPTKLDGAPGWQGENHSNARGIANVFIAARRDTPTGDCFANFVSGPLEAYAGGRLWSSAAVPRCEN